MLVVIIIARIAYVLILVVAMVLIFTTLAFTSELIVKCGIGLVLEILATLMPAPVRLASAFPLV